MSKKRFVVVDDGSGHQYIIEERSYGLWENWVGSEEWEDGVLPFDADRVEGDLVIHDYSIKE